MSLTDYEKLCAKSWALEHAQKIQGKSLSVNKLIDNAAKINGFMLGGIEAKILEIKNNTIKKEK